MTHSKNNHSQVSIVSEKLAAIRNRHFDVVVIGAGPAGSLAGIHLMQQDIGRRVLLIDKATFPRDKTCGCCINHAALRELEVIGAEAMVECAGGPNINDVQLYFKRQRTRIELHRTKALSRGLLDSKLTGEFTRHGGIFLDGVAGQVEESEADNERLVTLRSSTESITISTDAVVIATGLKHQSGLKGESWYQPQVASNARIGLATRTFRNADRFKPNRLHMGIAKHGYVGLVHLEDGSLDIAAAVDANFVKHEGGPQAAMNSLLFGSDMPTLDVAAEDLRFTGTPLLTQRQEYVAGEGVYLAGDAAGYVEPFTGEGIGWAMASGRTVADVVDKVLSGQLTHQAAAQMWNDEYRRMLGGRQGVCRWVATALRHPLWVRTAISMLRIAPPIARPFTRRISRPYITT